MAGERADILFRAELDASGAITSLQAFKGEAGAASTQAGGAFGMLAGQWTKLVGAMAAFAGGRAIVGFLKESVAEAMEEQDAIVKLDASLKATGYSAGLTGNQIRLFAREMSYLSGTTEEEIANAAALLSTYKEVRGEGFEETIKVARDLAAVMGTDLASATQLLGKVQQDPIQGMTMMRRAGIVLTDAEKDLVKTTTELNGTQAGQAKVLELVKSRVEGVADAMAGTLSGQLKTMANQWGELKEALGAFIITSADLPGVTKFWTDFFTEIRKGTEGVGTAVKGLQDAMTRATAADLTAYAERLKAQIETLKEATKALPAAGRGAAATERIELMGPAPLGGVVAETYRKNIATLMELKAKLGEVTRELKAKTVAETAANEATKHAHDLTEDQAKALQSLLDKANPLAKAEADYAETLKLLNQARATGEITTKQYAGAIGYAAEQLEKARRETGLLLPAMQQLGEKFDWIRDVAENFTQKLPAATAFTGQMFDWIRDVETVPTEPFKGLGDDAAKVFGNAFKDGFLAVMEGDDLKDPLKEIFGGFAGMFAQAMGDTLEALVKGKPLTGEGGALQAGGLWTKEKGFNWAGAGMMAGGVVASYGQAQGSRAMGAVGGAAMAASIPGIWTIPIVGIVATIAGALVGYFTSGGGAAGERATMGLGGGRGYVYEITGGVNKEAELRVAQQITQRYQTTVIGFRDTLRKMDADLGKIPDVRLQFNERTKGLQSAIDAFIKGTVPRAVFEAYKPALSEALTNLGVGADRIKEELQKFTDLDFDTAMAGFGRWISALVDITDVTELLLKTPEEMRAEVNRTMREGFLAGIDDVLERAGELAADAGELFSAEQVANAEQLISLGKQQYQETLNWIAQLETVSKGLSDTLAGTLLGFEEQRAASGGPESLGAFYQRQLESLAQQMAGATSAEQVQTIYAQMAKFGQLLAGLGLDGIFGGGAGTPWGEAVVGTQEWVEQYLRAQEAAGQLLIEQWEKEAADRNAALAAVMEAQRAALIAATEAAGSLANVLPGVTDGLEDLNDSAAGVSESLRAMRDEIDGLAAALAGIGGGAGPEGAGRYA